MRTAFLQVLFVFCGLLKGFGFQMVSVVHSSNVWVIIVASMPFLGPLIVCLLLRPTLIVQTAFVSWKTRLAAIVLDVCATCFNVIGYRLAGGGVVSIFCAGMPVITAILQLMSSSTSSFSLSARQVVAMLMSMAGLIMVPSSTSFFFNDNEKEDFFLWIGCGSCFIGVILNSIVNMLMEQIISRHSLDPIVVLFGQCCGGCLILSVAFVFTCPPTDTQCTSLVLQWINHGTMGMVLLLGAGLIQALCWVLLLSTLGSVLTSMLQILRTALSMLISAYLWCDHNVGHCLTIPKCVGAIIVLASTVAFQYPAGCPPFLRSETASSEPSSCERSTP